MLSTISPTVAARQGPLISRNAPGRGGCRALSALRTSPMFRATGAAQSGVLVASPRSPTRSVSTNAAAISEEPSAPQEDKFLNQLLWDSIKKPLLSVGQKGVDDSHCNSLKNLMEGHGVVKVKFVGADPTDEQLQQLASMAEARALQQKGRTVMFAKAEACSESLLSTGAKNLKMQRARAEHRSTLQHQRRAGVPELDPVIARALSNMEAAGKLQMKSIDKKALWALADLPSQEAREMVAAKMSPRTVGSIVNASAWITSTCKRVTRELSATSEE